MNLFTKVFKLIFIVAIVSLPVTINAGNNVKIKDGEPILKIKANDYNELKFSNTFTQFNYKNIKTAKGIFFELSIPDYGCSNRIGDPKLPVMKRLIEIPIGATPSVKVISYSMTEYKLSDYGVETKMIPAQKSVSKNLNKKKPDFAYNTDTYSSDRFNADELVSLEVLGIMRTVRLARMDLAPVRYNPVTNTIQVYNDIEVEISFPGADIDKTIQLKKDKQSFYFESMFNSQLLNYKTPYEETDKKDALTKYPVKYVIVSAPAFKTILQPFIQWKIKKGFTVVEAYTDNSAVGTTTTSIKAYIKGLYDAGTTTNPAPTFVLFVGDIAQIPTFTGTTDNSHVTDLNYCEYTSDYMPEIYYGRFSATSTTELQPQIDKTLQYEQYTMPDPSFLGNCVMISGNDEEGGTYSLTNGDGQINYGTTNYFNTAHGLTSYTYLYATSSSNASVIRQKISDGVCFANYTAHGDWDRWYNPSFTVSNVASMTNTNKYPLMIGNCCLSNKFNASSACFGEALLRASGKGAVGYIGASNSSLWDEDFYFGVGYRSTISANPTYSATALGEYDRVFHDHSEAFSDWYTTMDQMIYAGNLAVTQSGSSDYKYYWEIYCLMGDPSLMIYFGVPSALTATYDPIVTGQTTFTVNTQPYAYVAISQSGVLYGAALADASGVAVIPITPFSAMGTADVVATKQNRSPFISTVSIGTVSCAEYNENNNTLSCYPNPFNSSTTINYSLKNTSDVSIKIYNITGQQVAVVYDGKNIQAGTYSATYNADGLKAGIYHCVLTIGNKVLTQKLILR